MRYTVKRSSTTTLFCLIAFVSFTLTALFVIAQPPKADERTFFKLQHDWAEARKNADMRFLENFYAKEFSVGLMNGGESSREQDLAMFSSGDLKPTVIDDKEMRVYLYGETAMVTGLEHLEGSYKGRTGQFGLRFTNVFVYRDHRWQLVRDQAAQIHNQNGLEK
jgi:ketosteroid isomerase-like protein